MVGSETSSEAPHISQPLWIGFCAGWADLELRRSLCRLTAVPGCSKFCGCQHVPVDAPKGLIERGLFSFRRAIDLVGFNLPPGN
jgi:hypothetical protein